MLIAALALLQQFPENSSLDLLGHTRFSANEIQLNATSVVLQAKTGEVAMEELHLVRPNPGAKTMTFSVPRLRMGDDKSGQPSFVVKATFNGQPVNLTAGGRNREGSGKQVLYTNLLTGTAPLRKGAEQRLVITTTLKFGRCGYEQKQGIVAFAIDHPGTVINKFQMAFKYPAGTTLGNPGLLPAEGGWQTSQTGCFVRTESVSKDETLLYGLTWYAGDFRPIGLN
ncbi:MAG: hypothetical protein JST35_12115 [Armatimonadetes bacterium]|nr:hypothetical protein [Armatimonadota bacterium]